MRGGKEDDHKNLGSHVENSSIHLFDMCVAMVSQALALAQCAGFKDKCV